MALRIFGTDPETQPKIRQSFQDDVVGRFRSGYQIDGTPASLDDWRVTTGDPEVAKAVYEQLGGDAPQEWASKGEDNLEVFTASPSVEILLAGPAALRQKMVLWSRTNKLIQSGDGDTLDYPEERKGEPDPDRDLTFQERKQKGKDGIGPVPQIEVYFRVVGLEDLGLFKFQTGSWSMAQDLASTTTEADLAEINGPALATLTLEEVSYVAKNGPMKGKTVRYVKPVLKVKGAAPAGSAASADDLPF
jgi:hypothetical protein